MTTRPGPAGPGRSRFRVGVKVLIKSIFLLETNVEPKLSKMRLSGIGQVWLNEVLLKKILKGDVFGIKLRLLGEDDGKVVEVKYPFLIKSYSEKQINGMLDLGNDQSVPCTLTLVAQGPSNLFDYEHGDPPALVEAGDDPSSEQNMGKDLS